MANNIIFIGLMGAGKSTLGRKVAERYSMPFYDSDHCIEKRTGVDIPTIFDIEGEEGFRQRESQIISELCEQEKCVIATGGGALMNRHNREVIKASGLVVYLKATPRQLYNRLRFDKSRPLMQTDSPLQTLEALLLKRETAYNDTADVVVSTGRQSVNSILEIIDKSIALGLQQGLDKSG